MGPVSRCFHALIIRRSTGSAGRLVITGAIIFSGSQASRELETSRSVLNGRTDFLGPGPACRAYGCPPGHCEPRCEGSCTFGRAAGTGGRREGRGLGAGSGGGSAVRPPGAGGDGNKRLCAAVPGLRCQRQTAQGTDGGHGHTQGTVPARRARGRSQRNGGSV